MNPKKKILTGVIAALIATFFILDLGQYLSLDYLGQQKEALGEYQEHNPGRSAFFYMLIYIAVTALSLPGATVMTLAGGAIFGLGQGLLLVSFASTIGATLAFLISRTLLKESVQNRFGDSLESINKGMAKEGAFYLFGLRLVPLFPFFVINLVMGLTSIRAGTFFLVSQAGMLPGTLVYVNAGTQLASIDSVSGILSPGLLISFALLGLFPIVAKKALAWFQARKAMTPYSKPDTFDSNLIVIGAGAAGLVTSYIAAVTRAKVTLIEKHKMGGDCLNTGCVPSKALLRSAKIASYIGRSEEFGIRTGAADIDFPAVMERVQQVIAKVEPHDSVERYTKLGVDCVQGTARILDPYRVKVNNKTITARNIVVATGARPFVPPIPGIEETGYHTSDTIWQLRKKPKNLLVIGAGPIGCELAQAFHRLGVPVTQVGRSARLLPKEDNDVSEAIQKKFEAEGITVKPGYTARAFTVTENRKLLSIEKDGLTEQIEFDQLLLAVGRKANTSGLGLEELGVRLNPDGTIEVNEFLQTGIPTIYASGDVAGPYQFTHTAAHQAWYASVNSLFGLVKKFRTDYRVIPWCTFTDPEIARVGLNEQEAKAKGIKYEKTRFGIDDLDRAIADGEDQGFVKVLTVPGKDKILGVTIVGHHAGDLIAEYVTAMKYRLGLDKVLGTIHIYPTLTESNKYAAGEWKRAHAPERLMGWVGHFHRWRRNESRTKAT
ncbi:MAG: pyridine nucleotide-disulfide oxidoreductase [Proteobacteria bacterium]|nr:MAG: pyridine nucleotide-disulfide oxidoreductase [Pseudomonadota bacterium]